jgi:hypothetical protein
MARLDPATLPVLTINLEYGDSDDVACHTRPVELYRQFTTPQKSYPGHGFLEVNVSVLMLPDDLEKDWFGTPDSYWMRQKIRRAVKMGYTFAPFDHNEHLDEVYEINTSMDVRQGKPMTDTYRNPPEAIESYGEQTCPRHRAEWVGVFKDDKLCAYSQVIQCGEMMIFSKILGHGDHMGDGVMNLLVYEAAKLRHASSGTRVAVYYLQDSGTEGLQFFKRKMGFTGYLVHWELARPGVDAPHIEVDRTVAPSTAATTAVAGSSSRPTLSPTPARAGVARPGASGGSRWAPRRVLRAVKRRVLARMPAGIRARVSSLLR